MGRRRRSRRPRGLPLALLVVLLAAGAAYAWMHFDAAPAATPPPAVDGATLRVHYLDVGQGDGVVWELPDGSIVIYDCGPPVASAEANPMGRYLRDELRRPVGSTLWALVASHGHLDHVGGCEEVLSSYRFEHVYEAWYEGADAPASYARFLAQVRGSGSTLHTVSGAEGSARIAPGYAIALPDAAGVRATLLWPAALPARWDDIGPASLVVRLEHGGSAFCFQGDIEEAQERALASTVREATCDAYLVGHHGSRHASTSGWLARMQPDVAVVSFGENAYGHPTSEALCRVQQAGATVYATHRAGHVLLESDGARIDVRRGVPESADHCAEGASYWP